MGDKYGPGTIFLCGDLFLHTFFFGIWTAVKLTLEPQQIAMNSAWKVGKHAAKEKYLQQHFLHGRTSNKVGSSEYLPFVNSICGLPETLQSHPAQKMLTCLKTGRLYDSRPWWMRFSCYCWCWQKFVASRVRHTAWSSASAWSTLLVSVMSRFQRTLITP